MVSIIASSYNHERWIVETLESIGAQTFRDFELVYADDASSDQSVNLATAWLRDRPFAVQTVLHSENRGVCRTFNDALKQCRGRYLQIVSCDDILRPEKLARQVDILGNADPDVALVYSGAEIIDADSAVVSSNHHDLYCKLSTELPNRPFEWLLRGNTISAPSVLVRADALRTAGGYDEGLSCEDWDMWLRLARNWRFVYSSYVSVAYRLLGNGLHTRIPRADTYWTLRKHVDAELARSGMLWVVHCLYESGTLTDDIRHNFLDCARSFADLRSLRNHFIRWNAPPSLCRSLITVKNALKRAGGLLSGSERSEVVMAEPIHEMAASSVPAMVVEIEG
ncbi:MAG TPA: glycosyltransferase [Pirellulales bacterium]|nr:glycosyltransferase [Pirellulales bacterium]